jgi:ribosomal protein S18 acetylase RimI-like enzyme
MPWTETSLSDQRQELPTSGAGCARCARCARCCAQLPRDRAPTRADRHDQQAWHQNVTRSVPFVDGELVVRHDHFAPTGDWTPAAISCCRLRSETCDSHKHPSVPTQAFFQLGATKHSERPPRGTRNATRAPTGDARIRSAASTARDIRRRNVETLRSLSSLPPHTFSSFSPSSAAPHSVHTIATPEPSERSALLALAVETGLFSADEADALLGGVLDAFAAGTLDAEHTVRTIRVHPESPIAGWSYYAPDAFASGVWNVWWIGFAPSAHGSGLARELLHHIESSLVSSGARVVVIETSDQPPLARARRFYAREGYRVCGRVPDFYGNGDGKVIFAKTLPSPSHAG